MTTNSTPINVGYKGAYRFRWKITSSKAMKLRGTSSELLKLEVTLQWRRDYDNAKVYNGELLLAALTQGVGLET